MARVSKAAYTLVDLNGLEPAVRDEIVEDAFAGGGEYGIVVVEENVNGSVRVPVFGFYDDQVDRWAAAKERFSVKSDLSDADEEAIREKAELEAQAQADAVRAQEDKDVSAITKEDASTTTNKAKR